MRRFFHMDKELFKKWTEVLIEDSYDWKRIGISDDYCNKISEPRYGLRVIDWNDRSFEVVNSQKYMTFLLRYQ